MKTLQDLRLLSGLSLAQGGVFSTADLRTALADPHPAAFGRRVRYLIEQEVLFRFTRGFYVLADFELPVLSQRIARDAVISLESVLAADLVIGTDPKRRLVATRSGRPGLYSGLGYEIEHLSLAPHLSFGFRIVDGIRYAEREKAVLDVLYFHLRGRRAAFDLYSDLNLHKLDLDRAHAFLQRYRNPKFVTFAERVLGLS